MKLPLEKHLFRNEVVEVFLLWHCLKKELKSKTILMGFGLNSDAIHSPNEHFGIWNYLKGIETIPWFYKYFTELSK